MAAGRGEGRRGVVRTGERRSSQGGAGAGEGGEMPREREKLKKERKRKRRGLKKRKGPDLEVEGLDRENAKRDEGGCKRQGVGKQNCQGETLGFEVGWAWAGWATLSLAQIIFSFAKIIFQKRRRLSR